MGQGAARDYKSNQNLYLKIKETVSDLIYRYEFWTDPKICAKLSLVYYDNLIQFEKSSLVDVSTVIGIKSPSNTPQTKEALCKEIISHYEKRINLLKKIWTIVDTNRKKIVQATHGPVCKKVDKFVENFFTCQEYGGLWLDETQYRQIIANLKESNIHEDWIKFIEGLESKWYTYMDKFLRIITIIKEDIDNKLDDVEITNINDDTDVLIKKINGIMDIYYLLAINYA